MRIPIHEDAVFSFCGVEFSMELDKTKSWLLSRIERMSDSQFPVIDEKQSHTANVARTFSKTLLRFV
jgi:hypothetical protein